MGNVSVVKLSGGGELDPDETRLDLTERYGDGVVTPGGELPDGRTGRRGERGTVETGLHAQELIAGRPPGRHLEDGAVEPGDHTEVDPDPVVTNPMALPVGGPVSVGDGRCLGRVRGRRDRFAAREVGLGGPHDRTGRDHQAGDECRGGEPRQESFR
jgi:hypothetical protein